jgi:hypothetical protein
VVLEGNPARMIVISTRLGRHDMANEPSTTTKRIRLGFIVSFSFPRNTRRAVCWSWRRLRHGASLAQNHPMPSFPWIFDKIWREFVVLNFVSLG